ncbi:AMP-binding protein [Mycobacterium kyogaense]|uniref:AMP-binding protein n=1 Tax=Mycobacterium kyogaense TaxID=2212479 RepID=UPI0013C4C610|nr:AMP-binding protein [Mycobacterium kyogaense]
MQRVALDEQRTKSLPQLLAEQAHVQPDRPFLQEAGGPGLTYAETQGQALQWAVALRRLGVGAGDRIATMIDNCIDGPVIWAGAALVGAVDVSISTAYRGTLLAHALNLSEAGVLYTDASSLHAVAGVLPELKSLRTLIVRGPKTVDTPELSVDVHWQSDLLEPAEEHEGFGPFPAPHDIACVVFTSGTTGPSKGVLVPWGALATGATALNTVMTSDDVFYLTSAANHLIARIQVLTAAQVGASVVLKRAFRTQDFWADIDRYGCTYSTLVGAMGHFLLSQPESPDDADHPLRKVTISPVHPRFADLMKRFGITHANTAFGMTECPSPIRVDWNEIENPATCGRVPRGWPGWQVRLVDENDYEVAPGEVGELIVRTDAPWSLAAGYLGMPEQTATAWRNGWFHTGDAFKQDEHGRFYFVDRIKDSIRRRGENVSSFEVEMEVTAHPEVAEAAAIAVPAGEEGDEIKVFVVPVAGKTVDPEDLIRFLTPRMARYMIPRYIESIDSLPKTPTQRVQKMKLRELRSGQEWDRVAAGIELPSRG